MIRDIPISERPRERAIREGVEVLSNIELLSIIIRTGTKNKSVYDLSREILNLGDISNLSFNKLLSIKGIGKTKAIEIISLIEFSKRMNNKSKRNIIKIKSSKDIYNNYKDLFNNSNQEMFYCIYLNNKNIVIDKKLLFIGTINKSIVHPREIFKYAYYYSASSIICIHNHPSGDITPSMEDKRLTDALISIGKIQNIPVIDHIIIGNNNYYSFNDNML